MQVAKLGLVAAIVIGAVLGLMWAVGAVPQDDLVELAWKAYAGLAVLIVAAAALRVVRPAPARDPNDRPAP